MGSLIDLTGRRFGRLLVLRRAANDSAHKKSLWHCRCECGQELVVIGQSLRGGRQVSCGCWRDEQAAESLTAWRAEHPDMTEHVPDDVPHVCAICGTAFADIARRRYCSPACQEAGHRRVTNDSANRCRTLKKQRGVRRGSVPLNLIGRSFGTLAVVAYAKSQHGKACWLCRCRCGQEVVYRGDRLRSGKHGGCPRKCK